MRSKRLICTLGLLLGALTLAVGVLAAPTVRSARDAMQLAFPAIASLNYEEARVYFANTAGEVLKTAQVTQRAAHGVSYIPWELAFSVALPPGTGRIYMVHNHPSGNPQLSEADIRLGSFWAGRAAKDGVALDLIALTRDGQYTSLRESGQLRPAPQGLAGALDYAGYILAPGAEMLGAKFGKAFGE